MTLCGLCTLLQLFSDERRTDRSLSSWTVIGFACVGLAYAYRGAGSATLISIESAFLSLAETNQISCRAPQLRG
jgi:hypothetical protein